MTNLEIQKLFRRYNNIYFGGKLPKHRVYFSYAPIKRRSLGLWFGMQKWIEIYTGIRDYPSIVKSTLLHEMCHIKLAMNGKDKTWQEINANDHGPEFEKEMLRLAKKGAFKGLW